LQEWKKYEAMEPEQETTAQQLQLAFWTLVAFDIIFMLVVFSLR
jgi:hypothetical protein